MARAVSPEAHYALAVERLGLDRASDAAASRLLSSLLTDRFVLEPTRLRRSFDRRTVLVMGAGPCDRDALARASRTSPVVVAGSAIGPALEAGVGPALCVSDLDGNADAHVAYSARGVPVAVHAHGDNTKLLDELVPRLTGPLVGTSQTPPPARPVALHRFGGFTDGDRACYVAAALGAARVLTAGFALDDPTVDARKATKLAIARTLLEALPIELAAWDG